MEDQEKNEKLGELFVVSTPIGNDDDISMRALKVMNRSDIIVCEEPKVGARTLKKYNIKQQMHLLNENNETEKTQELLIYLKEGQTLSLISDAGTPVFADPGLELVRACLRNNIPVNVVPGASSIMAALVRSGLRIDRFTFGGFLHRDRSQRIREIEELSNEDKTVVLLETPYRLLPVLEAFTQVIPDRKAYIACNLTMKHETHHYGTFKELLDKFSGSRFKGEFVIVFEGNYRPGAKEEYRQKKKDSFDGRKFIKKNYGSRDSNRGGFKSGYKKGGGKGRSYDKGKSYGNKGKRDFSKGKSGQSGKKDN